ncbi:MAG: hypothetical protein V1791_14730 [Pseudomonadota bacterium]
MKKRIVWILAVFLAPLTVAYAAPAHANSGLSINLPGFGLSVGHGGVGLNIGLPWVVAPAPVYAYPDNTYEPVVTEVAPEFVLPPELGFYVAVGVPYDLFYYNNSYYVNRGNIWYNSSYYNGPWSQVYYSDIPYLFNRYPFERIRHYRDSYYGRYQRHGAWEGYSHFRPGHRNDYRAVSGRDSRTYVRPHIPNQTYRNRPDVRRPDSNWQSGRSGFDSNRQINRDRNYRDSRAYTKPNINRQANTARPTYNRPNGIGQRSGDRSAQIRPSSFAPGSGNRPVYTRPNRTGQSYESARTYTRPNGPGQSYSGRPAYSRADNGRTGPAWKNTSVQRSDGNGFNRRSQNRPDNGSRRWQGESR